MNEHKNYAFVVLSVAMIWVSNGFAQTDETDYKIVDSKEVPDVLSMLASVTEGNFEKIKTWEGRITNESIFVDRGELAAKDIKDYTDAEPNELPNEVQRISNGTVEFKIDVKKKLFFSLMKNPQPAVYLDTKKNAAYPSWSGSLEIIQIETPEHQFDISPLTKTKNNAVLRRIAIKERLKPTHRTDPREVFYLGSKTLWLTLSQLSQSLQIPGIEKFGVVIKKKTAGDATTYRIEISDPGKDRPFSILVLSGEAGFNCTYIENWYDDGPLMSKTTTEFVNQQGVFLPKKWNMSQYYKDGGLMRQESRAIEEMQINKPILDSTFSELTYLVDGDRYNDEIQKKKYTIKAGKLAELAPKQTKEEQK
jgi:hypothetical protein